MNYSVLALSSCGAKIVAQIGAVAAVYEKGYLNNINIYIGTSGGSIICLLLNIGYTINQIFHATLNTDLFQTLIMNGYFTYENIKKTVKQFHKECGLIDSSVLSSHIKQLMKLKLGTDDITFSELYLKTGKELCVVASNIDKKIPMYFNYKTSPDLKCIDAIEVSCNIPLFFKAIRYGGDRLVDGGLADALPILYYDSADKYILGINVREKDTGYKNKIEILDYGYKYTWTISERLDYLTKKSISDKCTIIDIEVNDPSVMLVKLTEDNKIDMYIDGYNQAMASKSSSYYKDDKIVIISNIITSHDIEDIDSSLISTDNLLPTHITSLIPINNKKEIINNSFNNINYDNTLSASFLLPLIRFIAYNLKLKGTNKDKSKHAIMFMKTIKETTNIIDNMNIYDEEDKFKFHNHVKDIVKIFLEESYDIKVEEFNELE